MLLPRRAASQEHRGRLSGALEAFRLGCAELFSAVKSKIVQRQVKTLAAKPYDLSSIPGFHVVERETKLSSDLHTCTHVNVHHRERERGGG